MEKLKCKKCGNESNSLFCPHCGERLLKRQKTVAEIEQMIDAMDKANKILDLSKKTSGKEFSPIDLLMQLAIKISLDWSSGNGTMSPLDFIMRGEDKNNEDLKLLSETIKMGVSTNE